MTDDPTRLSLRVTEVEYVGNQYNPVDECMHRIRLGTRLDIFVGYYDTTQLPKVGDTLDTMWELDPEGKPESVTVHLPYHGPHCPYRFTIGRFAVLYPKGEAPSNMPQERLRSPRKPAND